LDHAALRRELREKFDSNHHKNRATGKEGEADYRHHTSIALGKEWQYARRFYRMNSLTEEAV
jgi:hypothetical protein